MHINWFCCYVFNNIVFKKKITFLINRYNLWLYNYVNISIIIISITTKLYFTSLDLLNSSQMKNKTVCSRYTSTIIRHFSFMVHECDNGDNGNNIK